MIQTVLRVATRSKLVEFPKSYNTSRIRNSDYDDAKLRDIIASSNMVQARLQDKQKGITDTDVPSEPGSKPNSLQLTEEMAISSAAAAEAASEKPETHSPDVQPQRRYTTAKNRYHEIKNTFFLKSETSIKTLAQALNQITGYNKIEEHKAAVQQLEKEVKEARMAVKVAKKCYSDAIEQRSALQREVNELLTRKNSWFPVDVERFTELYKSDHKNQKSESDAKEQLENAEQAFDSAQLKFGSKILTRYHEEQLWSDKIRQALTWGTWVITGVNICLFVVATFFVEPWKRRRLVNAFHGQVLLQFDEYSKEIGQLSAKISTLTETQDNLTITKKLGMNSLILPGLFEIDLSRQFTSWNTTKAFFNQLSYTVQTPETQFLINKMDFAIISGTLVACSLGFASLLSYAFLR